MSNLIFPAAASHSRVNPLSPSIGTDPWRDRVANRGSNRSVMAGMSISIPVHNSIAAPTGVATADAGSGVYSAKQAAPPRGVPR